MDCVGDWWRSKSGGGGGGKRNGRKGKDHMDHGGMGGDKKKDMECGERRMIWRMGKG
jgi:hypothetical protein